MAGMGCDKRKTLKIAGKLRNRLFVRRAKTSVPLGVWSMLREGRPDGLVMISKRCTMLISLQLSDQKCPISNAAVM
jgi:hypothetical protein